MKVSRNICFVAVVAVYGVCAAAVYESVIEPLEGECWWGGILNDGAAMPYATTVCSADIPRWLSVMPLHEHMADELAADAAALGNDTFVDGIAWSCPVNPEGDPVTDRAGIYVSRYRKVAPKLRRLSSVKQGILLQSTMGHGGYPGTVTSWQLAVKPDGTSVYRMCPMDERFLRYVYDACRTFAKENIDFFMIDDDTRLVWGLPGCFCPLHLAEFSRRTGRKWSREEVVEVLTRDPECKDAKIWEAVKVDSLRRLFKTIREGFGDSIPGMLCVCWSKCHKEHAREFAEILALPGQTPVVRGYGAPYHGSGKDLFHVVGACSSYASQMATVGDGVIYMQEADTCPHTLWATSAVRMMNHLVMLALEGCKGAKIWITRTGNYHEKKSGAAYRRMFNENKELMKWATKVKLSRQGVVVPVCGPSYLNFGDRYLALTGIPYRFGKARNGEVTALTRETLELLSHDSISEILSGKVILDGPAAVWLTENGFAGKIGVSAKPWNRKTIQVHEFDNGLKQFGMRRGELTDLTETDKGVRIITKLHNCPNLGAELVYEAPGSILFENAAGGKVLVLAQKIPEMMPRYYEATLFSESYKAAMIRWLKLLEGQLPGGVCYQGVGPVTCMAGLTAEGENIVVLNALDIDGDEAPELLFEKEPSAIERLMGDGTWKDVRFEKIGDNVVHLHSRISVQEAAIFRCRVRK